MAVNKVWVFAEGGDGKVTSATLEMLTKARDVASTVEAVYSGPDAPYLDLYGPPRTIRTIPYDRVVSGDGSLDVRGKAVFVGL